MSPRLFQISKYIQVVEEKKDRRSNGGKEIEIK
jgi:hypothetical protein